jgi:hypothetical protein
MTIYACLIIHNAALQQRRASTPGHKNSRWLGLLLRFGVTSALRENHRPAVS